MSFVVEVSKGADLLENWGIDLKNVIDWDTLNMASVNHCIIAQAFPEMTYHDALDMIGCDYAREYGFDLRSSDVNYSNTHPLWDELEQAWKDEVYSR